MADLTERAAAKIKQWVGVFADAISREDGVSTPNAGQLAAYFGAHELRPAHLAAEQDCLQAGFRRRALAQRYAPDVVGRPSRAPRWVDPAWRGEQPTAQQEAAAAQQRAAAAEQARFDAQYQARQRQRLADAAAEAELERAAAKDDGWRPRHRVNKKTGEFETANAKAARECGYAHETFALAAPCAELSRSDLDLLGDLEVEIIGFRPNAHARRRAFFARIGASSRPVSLARAA